MKIITVTNLERLKMETLKLETFTTPNGTYGKLYNPIGEIICYTVEREWFNNRPSVSCVPAGVYSLKRCQSPKFGDTYCLINAELGVSYAGATRRTHILIHKANKPSELQGCIAPVSSHGVLGDEFGGYDSGKAYDKLMSYLESGSYKLEINRL